MAVKEEGVVKVIIAGGRDFTDYDLMQKKCDKILSKITQKIIIVSGTAKGADSLGERYAQERGYECKRFPADWNQYGRRAGYLRNTQMADYADALILFYDGTSKGSGHMRDIAKDKGLPTRIIHY